jgi:hypothetical protein
MNRPGENDFAVRVGNCVAGFTVTIGVHDVPGDGLGDAVGVGVGVGAVTDDRDTL